MLILFWSLVLERTVIRIALLSSETGKLTLQELYDALESRYP